MRTSQSLFTLSIFLLAHLANAFLPQPSVPKDSLQSDDATLGQDPGPKTARRTLLSMSKADEDNNSSLDIVLFGVGDLRTDDHEGLTKALSKGNRVLPLVVLDDKSLSNIPGVVSHTIDTANMVLAAVADLQTSLKEKLDLDLQVISKGKNVLDSLVPVIDQYAASNIQTRFRVHVHDLGDADNGLGYGPYSQIRHCTIANLEIVPWTCHLREKPWKKVETIPDRYPEFQAKYSVTDLPQSPVSIDKNAMEGVEKVSVPQDAMNLPKSEELVQRVQDVLSLDPEMVKAEVNSGIFQSHWGGLDFKTVGESMVLKNLKTFIDDCIEEDELWLKYPSYVAKHCTRNQRSLEHATFNWMLRGASGGMDANNLLAGEPMTRYLAAPLLLGTVSHRRIWHASKRERPFFLSPLRTLAEGREWHMLLAAKNIRTRPEYAPTASENSVEDGETRYGYWRWHGFLCRYARTPLSTSQEKNRAEAKKDGVLFFHGFGASATQWNKLFRELYCIASEEATEEASVEGLAPDLIGFGQAEKPPISYSIYVWDSQCTDFVKEIAVARQGWDSYIVGGNSIGGFSAASTAANECALIDHNTVCSSGAPGTLKCQGVVLMNPAGPIQSRAEVEKIVAAVGGDLSQLMTVAQISATGGLPPCKPLARPVARLFGNGLLSYLRPRIQSICANLYPTNPAAVDDALCETIERDSVDPGGISVMISGTKLPPPRSMNEMLKADYGRAYEQSPAVTEAAFGGPVLVATGVLDPLNDARGRSEGLAALRDGIDFDPINAGHCPHDELPKDVANSIAKWMATKVKGTAAASKVDPVTL